MVPPHRSTPEDPDKPPLDERWALDVVWNLYHTLTDFLPETATLGQVMVLNRIYRHHQDGGCPSTVESLARETHLEEHSVRRILHRFLEDGLFIRRDPARENQRIIQVIPAPGAGEILQDFAARFRAMVSTFLRSYDHRALEDEPPPPPAPAAEEPPPGLLRRHLALFELWRTTVSRGRHQSLDEVIVMHHMALAGMEDRSFSPAEIARAAGVAHTTAWRIIVRLAPLRVSEPGARTTRYQISPLGLQRIRSWLADLPPFMSGPL